jgi:hypothetical protein
MGTMVSWIFHVPDTYEMLWWLMICICWFGIVTEFRLKKLQKQLDEMQEKERPASER